MNLTKLVLEWKEAPKRFESIGVSKYSVKSCIVHSTKTFKTMAAQIRAVQEPSSRLGSKKIILQVAAAFSNEWIS
jgi:hypothetical protein